MLKAETVCEGVITVEKGREALRKMTIDSYLLNRFPSLFAGLTFQNVMSMKNNTANSKSRFTT